MQPFHVPREFRHVRSLLSDGQVKDASIELWRLASVGSNTAAATLGYMCLTNGELDGIDSMAAFRLCAASANRGDRYAEYVIAWHEYEKGNLKKLSYWLNRSAKQKFPPAVGDLGLLLISPADRANRRISLSKRLFRIAGRLGHLPSVAIFLRNCRAGVFGKAYMAIGCIFLPFAVLLMSIAMWLYPFSILVSTYPAGKKKLLFTKT